MKEIDATMIAAHAEENARALLLHLLRDPAERGLVDLGSEGLRDTPQRLLKALGELTEGYAREPKDVLSSTFSTEGYDGLIAVRAIPFVSLCEHHVLPFTGTVDVGYLPSSRVVGLSKIPRLVRVVTRRLQIQERIGVQIADAMQTFDPRGVAVRVCARHSCMSMRGVESSGEMVTQVLRGVFREDPAVRAEVLRLLGGSS